MLKIFIVIFSIIFSIELFSQVNPIKPLIGLNESEIKEYFNVLANKNLGNINKINLKSSVDKNGNLIYEYSVSIDDESKVNFLSIACVFEPIQSGEEICTVQMIVGSDISAYNNLKSIKMKFNKVGENLWSIDAGDTNNLFAMFEKDDDNYALYYYLEAK